MKYIGPWNMLCESWKAFREILVSDTNEAKYLCKFNLAQQQNKS